MRPFETATVLLLVVAWGSYVVFRYKRPRWLFVLPALAVVAAIVQLSVEHYRWQMVPAYALAALLFIVSVSPFLRKAEPATIPIGFRHRILRISGRTLGVMALVIAIALPMASPIIHLPTPSGQYAVGTTTLELLDQSRPEMYPPQTKLLVLVWYPAEKVSGAMPQPYWTEAYGPFSAGPGVSLPDYLVDYLSFIPTHAYRNAPVAHARPTYPVLIFSHGYGDNANQNTVQMEELSSHGYVVFSLAHPYTAPVVDGRTVSQNQALEDSLNIWTQATRFVLDELERLNRGERPSLFAGRLDLNRIGLFGHSLGGATAGEVCLLDSRCKAGVNMDGSDDLLVSGGSPDRSLKQPFMIMYSNDNVGAADIMYNHVENQAYRVFIKGTRHGNFSDKSLGLLGPLGGILFVGPIDGQRMETILNRYLVAFFDKHLMGIASPLLDGPDPKYPEVDFQRR